MRVADDHLAEIEIGKILRERRFGVHKRRGGGSVVMDIPDSEISDFRAEKQVGGEGALEMGLFAVVACADGADAAVVEEED